MGDAFEDIKNDSKKKLDLLIPLGTDSNGTREGGRSIAEKIIFVIQNLNPQHLDIFVSDLSRDTTLEPLKELADENNMGHLFKRGRVDYYDLNDVDDFEDIYNTMAKVVKKNRSKYDLKIDYTSGTKAMTLAATSVATVNKLDLVRLSGERGVNSIIQEGTEIVDRPNLKDVHTDQVFIEIEKLFNNYNFYEGIERLDAISINEDDESDDGLKYRKLAYNILFMCYKHFDDFNHKKAVAIFSRGLYLDFEELKSQLVKNYAALSILSDEKDENYNYYLIGSLYNNAFRRAEEGRFDDAIARMYHCIEEMTNIALKEIGIDNPSDIDINTLLVDSSIKKGINRNISSRNEDYYVNGVKKTRQIKFISSLAKRLDILHIANRPIGKEFKRREKYYKSVLKLRNRSIVAHGNEVRDLNDFVKIEKMASLFFNLLNSDSEKIIEMTKFPSFDVR